MINPETLAAQYKGKVEVEPVTEQDLYEPGKNQKPSSIAQIPKGVPVPEGTFMQQVTGRGMAVVPPQKDQTAGPQVAVVPPQQGTRTTIGTIVEPNNSNPLVHPKQISILAKSEPVEEPPKQKRKLDLGALILDHINQLGGPKSKDAQSFYDKSHDTLEKWMKQPSIIQLGAIIKYMDRNSGLSDDLMEDLEPHFSFDSLDGSVTSYANRTKLDVMWCSTVLDHPTLPFTEAFGFIMKKYEMGFTYQSDTVIHRSRNMLAKRFLESGHAWSFWVDSDMVIPIGHADWFRSKTRATSIPDECCNYEALSRLLNHKKAIIGGVYASRIWRQGLVIQPEVRPRNHEDKLLCNEIRRGTARGLAEVDWIGFGCALIHRQVFLEVQRNFPQLAPQVEFAPWRFFQPESDEGEDEAFCRRVRSCAIPIWLDTQLVCGHIGRMAFMPEMTAPMPAI